MNRHVFGPVRRLLAAVTATAVAAALVVAGPVPAYAGSQVVYNQNPVSGAAVIGPGCGQTSKYNYGSSGSWLGAGGDYTGATTYGGGGGSCSGSSAYILDQATQTAQFRWHAHTFYPTGYSSTVCRIWAWIGTRNAGDLHARYDFWADDGHGNLTWLGWPGGTVDQENHSGWAYLGQVTVANTPTLTVTLSNADAAQPGWYANAGDIAVSCPAQTPLPPTPTYLATTGTDTLTPVLSGVVQSPDGGQVTGKIFLADGAGHAIGGVPTATGTVASGERVSYRVPDGVLTAGGTYRWTMQACQAVCSAATATQTFTVNPASGSPTGSASLTITGTAVTASTAIVDPTGCAGAACPATGGADLDVGSDGTNHRRSALTFDLSQIPAGAQVVTASLQLTQAGCLGACTTHTVDVVPALTAVASASTGAALVAAEAQTGPIASASGPGTPGFVWSLTGAVNAWLSGDVPNAGIVLQDDAETTTSSGLRFAGPGAAPASARPQLIVGYNPATAPSAPTGLSVVAGDGGLLARWHAPDNPGDTRGLIGYTVTVSAGTVVVQQVQTQDTRALVTGLANGTRYTVAVTATNPSGTGPVATGTGTAAAVPGGTGAYVSAAQQFLAGRYGLQSGTFADADAAIAANSQGSAFAAQITGESTTDTAIASALAAENATLTAPGLTVSDALASLGADGVTVTLYLSGDFTYTTTVTDSSGPDSENGEEKSNYLFTFTATPGIALTGYVDADAADQQGTEGTQLTAASTTLNDNPGVDPSLAPAASSLDPAAAYPSAVPAHAQSTFNRSGVASWAAANAYHPNFNGFPEDCTDFASMALGHGGGLLQINWMGGIAPFNHADDRNWYYGWFWQGWRYIGTHSWSQAVHLANSLSVDARGFVLPLHYAQNGDVIFVNWSNGGFWGISHAGVIVGMSHNGLNVRIAQHSRNAIDTLAYWRALFPALHTWVYRVTG
jgi:hypothetical protein